MAVDDRGDRGFPKRAKQSAHAVATVLLFLVGSCTGLVATGAARERLAGGDSSEPPSGTVWLDGGDVRLAAQQAGPRDGPLVVLVHGTGGWSELWRPTLDALGDAGHHAVALDMPPFGYSDRPRDGDYSTAAQGRRIHAALRDLGATDATLVGHSFGARATLTAALEGAAQGDAVGRLVLVDPALDLPEGDPGLAEGLVASTPPLRRTAAALFVHPLATGPGLRALVARDDTATPERVRMLQAPMARPGTTHAVSLWLDDFLSAEAMGPAKDPAAMAAFDPPVLILWGDRDDVTPLDRMVPLTTTFPNARLHVLEDVGHIPQVEDPATFQHTLLDFLPEAPLPLA